MELPPPSPPPKVEITKEMWIKGNGVVVVMLLLLLGLYSLGIYLNACYHRDILNIDRKELKSLGHIPEVHVQVDPSTLQEEEKEDKEDLIEVSPVEIPIKI